jgi:hypothetical protein
VAEIDDRDLPNLGSQSPKPLRDPGRVLALCALEPFLKSSPACPSAWSVVS